MISTDFLDRIERNSEKASFTALNRISAEMQNRIFTDGKATDLTPLGQYSPKYAKYRRQNNRQDDYKDLEVYGDLRRSIQVGVSGKKYALGFATTASRLIATYQQEQTNKTIFRANKAEINLGVETYLSVINE